jgi:AcrR family transcriptional regulator
MKGLFVPSEEHVVTEGQQVRRRNAAATKSALLDAAAELFAERGYDRTTVREIAARAGVNQALLFRYFGTKDALFATVVAVRGRERLVESPPEQLLARTLRGMLGSERSVFRDQALQALLRASAQDSTAERIRREVVNEYAKTLAKATDAPDAELRADLALAWLAGINLLRSVTLKEPLASADSDKVVAHVMRAIRALLEHVEDISAE